MVRNKMNIKNLWTKKNLRNSFARAINYVVESKNYIYFVLLLFIFSIIVGFVFYEKFYFLDELLKEIIEKTRHLSGIKLIWFIFKNNLWSAFVSIIFGLFFGIVPLMGCILNGSILGYVMRRTLENYSVFEFWKLLPHGIFELPAIFISMALGLKIGMFVFSKNWGEEIKTRIYNSLLVFLIIIFPLIMVAAIIEGVLITLLK
ncbi:MAG: stage II sporulation protein M [Candidatus Pacearchaeota archaeon]|nr:stage II sporulation protein M [Candidatus Pacearchaeota archaeon]